MTSGKFLRNMLNEPITALHKVLPAKCFYGGLVSALIPRAGHFYVSFTEYMEMSENDDIRKPLTFSMGKEIIKNQVCCFHSPSEMLQTKENMQVYTPVIKKHLIINA